MSAKKVGTIKTASQKSIGCLYRPSPSQETLATSSIPKNSLRGSRVSPHYDSARKRANSVGKIYTTSGSERRASTGKEERCRREYHHLINYQQMENKLSNYLTCTIRTTNRQKYNYLSQHYVPLSGEPEPFSSKLKYCENEIRPRKNILQLTDDLNRNNFQCPLKNKKTAAKLEEKTQKPASKRVQDKENLPHYGRERELKLKKENTQCLLNKNHHVQKEELSKKLMKIIDSYENKNKQLSLQMHKIEKKFEPVQSKEEHQHSLKPFKQKDMVIQDRNEQTEEVGPSDSLNESFKKLIQTNLKSICLSCDCDQKLDDLWRCLHNQVVLDERLRIMRAFINQDNMNIVFEAINGKRIKKLEISSLKKNSEEYDPFLIEKIGDIMKTTKSDFTSKNTLTWITENFIKCYDESERHWLKYLSQQKMECFIRTIIMEQQITGLRQNETTAKQLNLRDFTRWLSTLFKANLRNRNVYQIYIKLKNMSYMGRFIEILEGKAGKGSEGRKLASPK